MARRKVVGLTCGTGESETSGPRQTLNRAYIWAVERAGGLPIILPVTGDAELAADYVRACDGLLLTGGVDVMPARYHAPPHEKLGEVDADRDTTEFAVLQAALAQELPLFAICRGLQVLNVALGGTLYQDLPSEWPDKKALLPHSQTQPRPEATHVIEIRPDSRLRAIVGATEMRVNSFHHQAARVLAPGLVVTARAPDGGIEAVEDPARRYLLGVQFHPEETAPHDALSQRLFQAFVDAL